jgi:hypothetical protein
MEKHNPKQQRKYQCGQVLVHHGGVMKTTDGQPVEDG